MFYMMIDVMHRQRKITALVTGLLLSVSLVVLSGCATTDTNTIMLLNQRIVRLENAEANLKISQRNAARRNREPSYVSVQTVKTIEVEPTFKTPKSTFTGGMNQKQKDFILMMMEYLGDSPTTKEITKDGE
jgi:hypothetical protein